MFGSHSQSELFGGGVRSETHPPDPDHPVDLYPPLPLVAQNRTNSSLRSARPVRPDPDSASLFGDFVLTRDEARLPAWLLGPCAGAAHLGIHLGRARGGAAGFGSMP